MVIASEVFHVFISHKHDDYALAHKVKDAIEQLGKNKDELNKQGRIECFVSGVDIAAGMDWRRQIRTALARSHLLVLLFTAPAEKHWDWCLYETGLYTRFDKSDVGSVVCLFNSGQASPSPLADLQGVPAEPIKVYKFLEELCKQPWKICDDWRVGALAPDITDEMLKNAATAICDAFRRYGDASTYYPCHRIVLSLSDSDDFANGIPEKALVMEGPGDTSAYTMSLFDLAGGTGKRSWGDLLQAVHGTQEVWRTELDAHFKKALCEELFPPMGSPMRAGSTTRVANRLYRPILYSIVRGPAVGPSGSSATIDRRPRAVTIVLTPEPLAAPDTETG